MVNRIKCFLKADLDQVVNKASSKALQILLFETERDVSVQWFLLWTNWQSYKILLTLKKSFVWSRATFSKTLDNKGSSDIGL